MLLWKRFTDLEVLRNLVRKNRKIHIPVCGQGKVGATAGWVITGGTDIGHATMPAGVTAGTMVVPITGLYVGDRIRGLYVAGQVDSGGNAAVLATALKKVDNVAAGNTASDIGTSTTGNITADAVLSVANTGIGGINEEVKEGYGYFALLTGTTGASTDIDVTHIVVTVDQN